MSATINGRLPRTQLSDQIDRLDTMLDGLSEALNETIACAVRAGTRLALKDAIVEIMTDPALRSKLREATEPVKAPESAKQPSFWQAAKARVAAAGRALATKVSTAVSSTVSTAKTVVLATVNTAKIVAVVCRPNRLACVSAGVGLAIAAASYFAPHAIAAALSGVVGTAAAVGLRASDWTRRTNRIVVA